MSDDGFILHVEDGPFGDGYSLNGFFWMMEWNKLWKEVNEIQ